jgi:SOS response regulatory protein OraA/RecX
MMTTDSVCILAVRAAVGGARVQIDAECFDGEKKSRQTLSILTAFLGHLPATGEVDADEWRGLCRLAELSAAIDAGMRVLSAAGCSRRRLAEKLRARGFSYAISMRAVEVLAARGYLSESEGALREAERGVKKLWGDRRILADCRAKGYGDEALDAVKAYLNGENSASRCRQMLERRVALPLTDEAEIRRAVALLMRYGYTTGEIRTALHTARIK